MGNKSKNGSKNLLSILLIFLAIIFVYYMASGNNKAKEIQYTQFETIMTEGKVNSVNFVGGRATVLLNDSEIKESEFPKRFDYYFEYIVQLPIEEINEFNKLVTESKELKESGATLTDKQQAYAEYNKINLTMNTVKTPITQQMFGYVMFAGFIYIIFITYKMLMGKGGGAPNFGKSRAKLSEKSNIKFDNIAGAEEEKEETREVVEFLKNPAKFKSLGARIPKGILLVGEPGTGKTLLAKAVAGESNVPFFSISGSDFVELYAGVGASRVRDLFETAKRNAPCIIFIDEIDAVGRQRGAGMGGGNDEREQTLNQLLVEMDGFLGTEGIIVLAATNRADILDPALLRPGRFDRQIYVNVPDVKGREGIIQIHAKNKPIDKDVNFKEIARLTTGFTGADIENFLNEAAILAARDNRLTITMEDITEGINKVLMGPQKKSRLVTEKDRKITAYHEAGHAIIAKLLDSGDNVHEVSIIPRGRAGGYTSTRPSDDDEHFSLNKLNNRIAMIMGGRIAEDLVFGDITAGASSDISQATKIAVKMVTEWGMSKKVGFVNRGSSNEIFVGRDYQSQKSYSEETAALIDREVKAIIDENYARAVEILTANRDILDNMSLLLLEKETIYADEVDKIMARVDYKEIIAEIDKKEKARKRKEAKKRKEAEVEKTKQLKELKLRAAESLSSAGYITEEELASLKEQTKLEVEKIDVEGEEVETTETKENKSKPESKTKTTSKTAAKKPAKTDKKD